MSSSEAAVDAEITPRYCFTCSDWVHDDTHDDDHNVCIVDDAVETNGNSELYQDTFLDALIEIDSRLESFNRRLSKIERLLLGDQTTTVEIEMSVIGELLRLAEVVEDHEEIIALMDTPSTDSMSEEQRLQKIRQGLLNKAKSSNTRSETFDYTEVRSLFESKISESYASKLLVNAAGRFPEDGSKPVRGFEYVKRPGNKRSVLRLDRGKMDSESVSRVNNRSEVRGV